MPQPMLLGMAADMLTDTVMKHIGTMPKSDDNDKEAVKLCVALQLITGERGLFQKFMLLAMAEEATEADMPPELRDLIMRALADPADD